MSVWPYEKATCVMAAVCWERRKHSGEGSRWGRVKGRGSPAGGNGGVGRASGRMPAMKSLAGEAKNKATRARKMTRIRVTFFLIQLTAV